MKTRFNIPASSPATEHWTANLSGKSPFHPQAVTPESIRHAMEVLARLKSPQALLDQWAEQKRQESMLEARQTR